jgi:hypothetical protein
MKNTVASGTTGACTWELTGEDGDYTLTISGNGAMENNAPWRTFENIVEL